LRSELAAVAAKRSEGAAAQNSTEQLAIKMAAKGRGARSMRRRMVAEPVPQPAAAGAQSTAPWTSSSLYRRRRRTEAFVCFVETEILFLTV
jgi:hypothetical protein